MSESQNFEIIPNPKCDSPLTTALMVKSEVESVKHNLQEVEFYVSALSKCLDNPYLTPIFLTDLNKRFVEVNSELKICLKHLWVSSPSQQDDHNFTLA